MSSSGPRPPPYPQASITTFPSRISTFNTSLILPISQAPAQSLLTSSNNTPGTRTTKRGTQIINYAELEDDDELYEDNVSNYGRGSFSMRRTASSSGGGIVRGGTPLVQQANQQQPEINNADTVPPAPREPPIIIPRHLSSPPVVPQRPDTTYASASDLPSLLIPVHVIVDLDSKRRLNDKFLWNVYEPFITPQQFATTLVYDLDVSNDVIGVITAQIVSQLEELVPLALCPIPEDALGDEGELIAVLSIEVVAVDQVLTDKIEWDIARMYNPPACFVPPPALPHPTHLGTHDKISSHPAPPPQNPTAEFLTTIAADLSLWGDWRPQIEWALHSEALKAKRIFLDNNCTFPDAHYTSNLAAYDRKAGIRFDPEGLGDSWGPHLATLSREEREIRERDREREARRLRRSGVGGGVGGWGDDLDAQGVQGGGRGERKRRGKRSSAAAAAAKGLLMASPQVSIAASAATSAAAGAANPPAHGQLADWERATWRCAWCRVGGMNVFGVRDGPEGARTLCWSCVAAAGGGGGIAGEGMEKGGMGFGLGMAGVRDIGELPEWRRGLHGEMEGEGGGEEMALYRV